ncbi:hypothetical protein niasHT_006179 [Heterodera trifolii]|uniref:Uncharacterized protein n=1 Tax=Heterodera trifolii TaxID=157864 RepID=A0ABD2M2D0_9BILA
MPAGRLRSKMLNEIQMTVGSDLGRGRQWMGGRSHPTVALNDLRRPILAVGVAILRPFPSFTLLMLRNGRFGHKTHNLLGGGGGDVTVKGKGGTKRWAAGGGKAMDEMAISLPLYSGRQSGA